MHEYEKLEDKDAFDPNHKPGSDGPFAEAIAGIAAMIVMIGGAWLFFGILGAFLRNS